MARLAVFLFMKSAYSNVTRRSNRFEWLHRTHRQIGSHLSNLAILFVFLGLFDFILLAMLINSIKTDKLIIDTTNLVDSIAKIERTKARPVVYQMESDYKLISEAPEKSQLYRLFHGRFEGKHGLYLVRKKSPEKDLFKLLESDPSTYFFFMNKLSFIYTAFLVSSLFERLFFKPINYYETLSVTYLRKNLEKSLKSDLVKK